MTITMKHRGTFNVTCSDPNQCGFVGKQSYDYAVEIITYPHELDARGFILCTEDYAKLFENIKEVKSGEERAIITAKDLAAILVARGVKWFRLSVEIFGSDKTSFVARLTHGAY